MNNLKPLKIVCHKKFFRYALMFKDFQIKFKYHIYLESTECNCYKDLENIFLGKQLRQYSKNVGLLINRSCIFNLQAAVQF